ncbi:MAG: hypothetical protein OEV23_01065 [Gallionella sp.]|nr:hypothetical protein [Gallionella sp.]
MKAVVISVRLFSVLCLMLGQLLISVTQRRSSGATAMGLPICCMCLHLTGPTLAHGFSKLQKTFDLNFPMWQTVMIYFFAEILEKQP